MSYKNIPLGQGAPQVINVIVEISKGSRNKYEYDESLDVIRLDRVLHSPVFYPTDYGFIPHTRSDDGDHLDVMIIGTEPLFPGCLVAVRPIGVLDMEDDKGVDYKILAVEEKDPFFKNVHTLEDLDDHYIKEISHFFEVYKNLEDKFVKVHGWKNHEEAFKIINEAKKKFELE